MIQIQYWTPTLGRHIDLDTYVGWDTKGGNVWHMDRVLPPCWSNTDCIKTTLKPRTKKTAQDGPEVITRVVIPKAQINIVKSSIEAFMFGSNNDSSSTDEE